jgi:2-desacetyl-2-hydroxyethyl bacteriochlorophyllide A dehydrogenase
MKAAVFLGDGRVDIADVPDPTVDAPDTVIIEVAANALCGTDLHAIEVPASVWFRPGVILGHEFSGVVVDAGPDAAFRAGDRVAVLPNVTCGRCEFCVRGVPNMCVSQMGFGSDRIHGAAADFVAAPASVVHRVPDLLDLELAAIAEPLACVLSGAIRSGWRPGQRVVVLGGGPIGLMYMLAARAFGVDEVTVVEATEGRRKKVRELGGIAVDPNEPGVWDDLALAPFDVTVDTVGTLVREAVQITRKRGVIVLFGLNDRIQPPFPTTEVIRNEIRIEGVFLASNTFPLALQLLARGGNGFDQLITHRFALSEFDACVDVLRRGEAVKALLIPKAG